MSRVAAIDCGTNSIRLLIADIAGDNFKEALRTMEIVRLGQGVDQNKAFNPDAIDRTLKAVELFRDQNASKGVEKIRFCATSATRDATNRSLFTDGVRDILGIEVEVIPGEEEAELSFIGATKELRQSDAPFLVVDIGGGSTEFVLGTTKPTAAISTNVGCVRMTERHLVSDPATPEQIAAATSDIDAAIDQAYLAVPIAEAKSLIGLAGSVTTVAALALGLAEYDSEAIHGSHISASEVHRVTQDLLTMTRAQRATLGPMHEGRIDVIGSGALVLDRIMARTGLSEVVVSERDILDGIARALVSSPS